MPCMPIQFLDNTSDDTSTNGMLKIHDEPRDGRHSVKTSHPRMYIEELLSHLQ